MLDLEKRCRTDAATFQPHHIYFFHDVENRRQGWRESSCASLAFPSTMSKRDSLLGSFLKIPYRLVSLRRKVVLTGVGMDCTAHNPTVVLATGF